MDEILSDDPHLQISGEEQKGGSAAVRQVEMPTQATPTGPQRRSGQQSLSELEVDSSATSALSSSINDGERIASVNATESNIQQPQSMVRVIGTDGKDLCFFSRHGSFFYCAICKVSRIVDPVKTAPIKTKRLAGYCSRHLRGQPTEVHKAISHVVPSEGELEKQLEHHFSGVLNKRASSYILRDDLDRFFPDVLRSRSHQVSSVCSDCCIASNGNPCCPSPVHHNVASYHKEYSAPFLIVNSKTWEEFNGAKNEPFGAGKGIADTTRFIAPQPQSTGKRQGGPLAAIDPKSQSNAKRQEGPPVLGSTQQADVVDYSTMYGSFNPNWTDRNGVTQSLIMSHKSVSFLRIARQRHTFVPTDSGLDGVGNVEIEMWKACTADMALPTKDQAQRLCKQFPVLNRGERVHDLIVKAVIQFYEGSQWLIDHGYIPIAAHNVIKKVPLLKSMTVDGSVAAMSGDDYNNKGDFDHVVRTKLEYCNLLARWIIGMKECEDSFFYPLVQKSWYNLKQENAMQQNPDLWNLEPLVHMIGMILDNTVRQQVEIISVLIRPFLFHLALNEDDNDEDSDDEDDGFKPAPSNGGDGGGVIRFSKASYVMKLCSVLLHFCKRQCVSRFQELQSDPTYAGRCVVNIFANEFEGCLNVSTLALIIHRLSRIVENSGSNEKNVAKLVGTTIQIRQHSFHERRLEDCFRLCLRNMEAAFVDLFFERSQQVSDDQKFVQSLWGDILDCSSQKIDVLPDLNNRNRPFLQMKRETMVRVQGLLNERIHTKDQRDWLRNHIENFTKSLLGAIYLFSGAVFRMRDLSNLRLASGAGAGNLFPDFTWSGERTLVFTDLISKTKKTGQSVLSGFVGRLIMFDLTVLAKFKAFIVQQELEDLVLKYWPECKSLHAKGMSGITEPVKEKMLREFSSSVAVGPRLSAGFLKEVAENPEVVLARCSERFCVQKYSVDQVRSIIGQKVALDIFGMEQQGMQKLRKVMVTFKTNILSMLKPRKDKLAKDDFKQRDLFERLEASMQRGLSQEEGIQNLGTIGHHSRATNEGVYNSKFEIAGANVTVPASKYLASQNCEAGCALFARLPIKFHDDYGKSISIGIGTMHLSLSESAKTEDPNRSLLQELRSVTSNPKADWTCPEQQLAASIGFTTRSNLMISMPCGSGKTIAFILPTLAAKRGLSLVIVPYRSLLADMAKNIKRYDVQFVVWDSESKKLFQPVPDNVQRLVDGQVRFILAVEDTVVRNDESIAFIDMITERGMLNNIVIDECHQLVMSRNYRDVHRRLEQLSLLGVPLIFSSGTLPRGFRNMIMRCFHIVPSNTQVIVKNTSFDKRLIVDCIKTGTSNLDRFHEDILQIVEYHTTKVESPQHRVIIFCMTKHFVEKIGKIARNRAQLQRFKILEIHSDHSVEKIQSYLTEMNEHPGPVLALSTSFTAEGMNYLVPIGLVIVAAGAFGGVLSVQQMVSRAGRVSLPLGVNLPRAMVLYAPKIITDRVFGDFNTYENARQNELSPVINSERQAVSSVFGFKSLHDMFEFDTLALCGARLLEHVLNKSQSLSTADDNKSMDNTKKCGQCFACMGSSWDYPPLSLMVDSTPIEFSKSESVPMEKDSRVLDTISNELHMVRARNAQAIAQTHAFLQKFQDRCILCKASPDHVARYCPRLNVFLPHNGCSFCFQVGHFSKDVSYWMKGEFEQLPSHTSVKAWGTFANDEEKRMKANCAVVVKTSDTEVKPCSTCWFEHEGGECFLSDNNRAFAMRNLVLMIFHDKKHREIFMNEVIRPDSLSSFENISGAIRQNKGFKHFLEWAVYQKTQGLQNLYSIVLYWKGVIDA
jgi:DEAD/DEAH box helicase